MKRIRRKHSSSSKTKGNKGTDAPSEQGGDSMVLCHWNARGVVNKEELLKRLLVKKGVVCAGVVESHTYRAHGLSDAKWQWDPGLEVQPKPSDKFPPRGMGYFLSKGAKASMLETGQYSTWCRIESKVGKPVIVGESYFPHCHKTSEHKVAWEEIELMVEKFRHLGHIVLMGDFNAHASMNGDHRVDAAGKLMQKRISRMRLHIVNGFEECKGQFTRVQEERDGTVRQSTVDYICVSSSLVGCIESMELYDDKLGSDHKPMFLTLKGLEKAALKPPALREMWCVENIPHWKDKPGLARYVGAFQQAFKDWTADSALYLETHEAQTLSATRVAEKLERSFQTKLDEVAREQIGTKLVGPKSSPFLSRLLQHLEGKRRACETALSTVMRNGNSSQDERARAVSSYRQAKGNYFRAARERRRRKELEVFRQIERQQADSKLFWAGFKGISGGMKESVVPPPMAREGNVVKTDPKEVCEVWRRFSADLAAGASEVEAAKYDEAHRRVVEGQLDFLKRRRVFQRELDVAISEQEVFLAIRKMKMGKAPGVDGVLSSILKTAADAVGTTTLKEDNWVVKALVLLFNHVFGKEVWPTRWQSGVIFPIYKQDSRLEPGNYRPITLLSIVGKLFGSVVEKRLSDWSERTRAVADEQGGFSRNRGTPDLLFTMRETLMLRKALGLPTVATFIDARKAYDTVWREGNFVKLHNMGVRGKLWRQLQAMSSNPRSKVRLPFGETEWFKVSRGVAQGAVESPWLYNCYINDMVREMKNKGLGIRIGGVLTPMLMYADDIVLLAGTVAEMRAMNAVVSEFASRNRFSHNGKKSAVMVFNAKGPLRDRVEKEKWVLSGEPVKVKGQYKYLGVEILERVSDWKVYVDKVIVKAEWMSRDLAWLLCRDSGMRARSAVTLFRALVRPVMEYAAELWAGEISVAQVKRMEKIQTDFGRTMLGLSGVHRVANDFVRAELGLERMQSRWAKLRLGYWRRVHKATPDRLISWLARLRKMHVSWGGRFAANGWMTGTKQMLEMYGLDRFWHIPSMATLDSKEEWKTRVAEVVERHEDRLRKERAKTLTSVASARYQEVKGWARVTKDEAKFTGEIGRMGALVHEAYLDDHRESVGRKLKMCCRAGCLPVLDRVGRMDGWAPQLRKCLLCDTGEVETVQHLILSCPAHRRHRDTMLEGVGRAFKCAMAEQQNVDTDFGSLELHEQCNVVLGKTTGTPKMDRRVDAIFKRFMKKAWRNRKRVTRAVQKTLECDGGLWALVR